MTRDVVDRFGRTVVDAPRLATRARVRWWTSGEVAKAIGSDIQFVNEAIASGRLRAFKWGRWWRMTSDAVEQFLRASRLPEGRVKRVRGSRPTAPRRRL